MTKAEEFAQSHLKWQKDLKELNKAIYEKKAQEPQMPSILFQGSGFFPYVQYVTPRSDESPVIVNLKMPSGDVLLEQKQALALGRWIIETFSEQD